jgi:hypothetical protein
MLRLLFKFLSLRADLRAVQAGPRAVATRQLRRHLFRVVRKVR